MNTIYGIAGESINRPLTGVVRVPYPDTRIFESAEMSWGGEKKERAHLQFSSNGQLGSIRMDRSSLILQIDPRVSAKNDESLPKDVEIHHFACVSHRRIVTITGKVTDRY